MTAKNENTIAVNRKAHHEYSIEETFEAGLVLEGWEVKAICAGRLSFSDAYAVFTNGELFLVGANIQALPTAVFYKPHEAKRSRKLLLHKKEISRLVGSIERKGYTLVPLSVYWHHRKVKVALGLAKGKQNYDKRATIKEREWNIEKQRLNKTMNRD